MAEYEVMVEAKARKYYIVNAKTEEEAKERGEQCFDLEWRAIEDELQKIYGLSLDEDITDILVTSSPP